MKKKIFLVTFLLVLLIANISFASYSTVTMSVVEEPVCTINLTENSKFEKKLISKDLNNKEVTIQLQVSNEEISNKLEGEVVLLIDNSESMTHETSTGAIRKDLVFNSAKTLVTNLLEGNDVLKIGIVSFSTKSTFDDGTIDDACLVSALTNNTSSLLSAIDSIEANGPRTDLDAGLTLAKNQFSNEENNKYLIVLTDGVPNVAINYDKNYYSDDVIAKTKSKLQSISSSNINIITMLTGIADDSIIPTTTTKSYAEIISEVFGTSENPTAGQFYYITDEKIESTVNDIYNSLVSVDRTLRDITIIDYFPQEIIDNFDFKYVKETNIGTISTKVDTTNNSITWTIPKLEVGKTALVQYKLKLKETFDSSIVGKILNTNEKVDITYIDFNNSEKSKDSDVTPKLKLEEPSPSTPSEESPKELPKVLPKAGITQIIAFVSSAFFILIIFSAIKIISINKKMK